MITNPDCYIPNQVAIGPYHHLRPELYDMEHYKIAAARRNQKDLQNVKLKTLVERLMKFEMLIRASYHKPLGFGCEAMAWMMAVDASFLIEFLQVCTVKEGKAITRIPSRMAHLVDLSGNKAAHNAILRDIIMLENQIPFLVLRMFLELEFSSIDLADEKLLMLLTGLTKELSPFKPVESSSVQVNECAHLLEFIYKLIVPNTDQVPFLDLEIEEGDEDKKEEEIVFQQSNDVRRLRVIVVTLVSKLTKKPFELLKRIVLSKPLQLVLTLPWKILSSIPIIKAFQQPLEQIFGAYGKEKDEDGDEEAQNEKPPLQEEIAIPSVTQLLQAGVKFMPTNEGISSFNFDDKTLTLYIPVIKLDVNSEVVLRNLVAYEACVASGPLVLGRYAELMNGIIDTDVDARVLCQRGIISNHLKSEKEVADLWNGMSKSVKLTKVPCLDKVIADVNKFYNATWRVKCRNFMRDYVFGSWRLLTFLAAVVMMFLMVVQAFCQVYTCSRILRIKALEPPNP